MPRRDQTSGPASSRFLLRLGAELREELRMAARRERLSLNGRCVRQLARSVTLGSPRSSRTGPGVERAVEVFGGRLEGVVTFGSWARGDAADGSDIDPGRIR